ncbi:VCBS repeat-containing protein [Pseudanabaenaceae cyanobacterium LEGE 13415]|nr:VCBS repeat-containing protein [Pseudanabaenaceae cyanobacterium LEGE 13415]
MAVPESLNPLRVPDFNGDGRTDLFSLNINTRVADLNLVSGVRSLGSSSFSSIPSSWEAPKYGDFNGDRKTDLLWRDSATGANGIWLMNGASIQAGAFLEPLQGDWRSVIGEFNSDGKTDLFWYNFATGDYQLWLMDGFQKTRQLSGKIEGGWEPSIADFNNDGRTDLFWRNPPTGRNSIWTFDPQVLSISGESLPSKELTWNAEVIDFNGDGRSDIYWRDRLTGQNQVWTWTGIGFQPDATPIDLPGTSSDVTIRTADFEGNGLTDFLVRNPSTGNDQVWLSNGRSVEILAVASQAAGFRAEIGDYNGDRFSDIRWTSLDSTQSVIWFSNGILPKPMVA